MPAGSAHARRVWLIAAALFVGTFLLFAPAIGHDFVNYDDPAYVTENPHMRAGLSAASVTWAMGAEVSSNWHPLTLISHLIDVSLFALNPHGHHATSVLWHALNAVLVFLALQRLTGAVWTCAWFAALFAWHPLRVESVAWVSERKDVLSGFFAFAALWLYAVYAERRRAVAGGAGKYYALLVVAFALGLMAKPMLVTLPCVLLLLDYWPLRRTPWLPTPTAAKSDPAWWLVVEKLPLFALVAVSSVVTYHVQRGSGAVTDALSVGERVANAVVAVPRYLGKFLLPVDLAVLYPHPGHWPAGRVAFSVLGLVVLTAIAAWQVRRRPWIAVGWLWFIGMLVPVIGLVQVGLQSMADRYTYLPILGVQLAALWTLRDLVVAPAARVAWAMAGGLVLGVLAVATLRQIKVWENSFTLFDRAIAVTTANYLAHDNRGMYLYKAGRTDEALADYRSALAINATYMNANNNLGYALAEAGRAADAVPYYRAALKAQPNHLEVRNNLANALSDLGQLAEATEHFDFVLARAPDHINALNGSAVVLAMQNHPAEAKARLEHSLRLAPDNPSAHANLGNVCWMLGQHDEALVHYRRAMELSPNDAHTPYNVGASLNEVGRFAEAAEMLQRSLALRPNQPDALAQLGRAFLGLGRREEGLQALRSALQVQPAHAAATAWLQQATAAK